MKKHRREELLAVVAPGLEEVCLRELDALGIGGSKLVRGGVEFTGGLREIYLGNLHLRTASRILVRLGVFDSRSFPELFRNASRLPWGQFLRPGAGVRVRASSRGSRLFHTGRIASTVADAAGRALGGRGRGSDDAEQLVVVRIEADRCQISVDSSGDLLHRRGYRRHRGAAAPLRETLAAGLLRLAGWDGGEALVDPLCGSGTIPVEAALYASRRAPGHDRPFAFMNWPGYRPGLWTALRQEARQHERCCAPVIAGSDRDPDAVALAGAGARAAGVEECLTLETRALDEVRLPPGPGLILCNPPYGERLGRDQDLAALYAALGALLRRGGPGWRCVFLAPEDGPVRAADLAVRPLARLRNGGLRVALQELGGQ